MSRRLVCLLLLAACSDDGDHCTPGWTSLLDRPLLDRPLLSASGRGDEVLLVGGDVDSTFGLGAIVLRWDGTRWDAIDPGRAETLWWLWVPEQGDVWIVGERGLAMRWDGQTFHTEATDTTATLFGVWGAGPDDVWLVGGTPGGGTSQPNDLVLHWNGESLVPDGPPARGAAFFKVWGASKDDVWVVGEGGLIWRRTADGWHDYDSGTRDSLTTVHGCGPTEVYAVGGQGVYRFGGTAWARVAGAEPLASANGVHCGPDQVLVVGNGGLKLRYQRADDRWIDETFDEPFFSDFHGAWIGPDGELWAVGGNYNAPANAPRVGMIGLFTASCTKPAER